MGMRVEDHTLGGPAGEPLPREQQAGQGMPAAHQPAVLDHRGIERQEGVPHDRTAAQPGERPQHQDVEVAQVADEHDIVRGQAQVADDQSGVGAEPPRHDPEALGPSAELALVLDALPHVGMALDDVDAVVAQPAQPDPRARLAQDLKSVV